MSDKSPIAKKFLNLFESEERPAPQNEPERPRRGGDDGPEPKRFRFEFSLSGMITLCVVTVLGLVWVFILGVLLGRGYRPEKAVPEIAQIMPAGPEAQNATKAPTVLKAEDLEYMESLRRKPEAPAQEPPAPKAAPAPAPAPQPQQAEAPKPEPAKPAAPKAEPAKPEPVKPEPAKPESPKASAGAKFALTYQAAALDKREQAQEVVKKLSASGVKASIEEGKSGNKTVYRVVATATATEADQADLEKKIQSATGVKPWLKTRKPL